MDIKNVERHFARCREMCLPPQSIYAEVGRYKPFSISTIKAAERRGFRIEKLARGVYRIHDCRELYMRGPANP